MARFKQIAKSSFVYTLLAFLPTASRILLLPIFLLFLNPEDFAIISLNTLVATVLPLFMTLGLENAYVRYYYDYKRTEKLSNTYFSTIVISIFSFSVFFTLLLMPFGDFLFKLCFKSSDLSFFPFGITAALSGIVTSVNAIFIGAYRNKHDLRGFTIFSLGIFLVSTLSESLAILVFKMDVMNIIYVKLVATTLFSVIIWVQTFSRIKVRFDRRFLPASISYSLPLLPYQLSTLVFTSFDRLMIENVFSLASLAVYNLASAVANMTESIMFAIQSATYPTVYEMLKKGYHDQMENINKIYRLIGLGVLFIIGLLIACNPIAIIYFLKPVYRESIALIPILLMSYYFRYLYIVFSEPLFFFKATAKLPWLNIVLGVTTIAGNLLLLPEFGLAGSAATSVLARFTQLLLTFYWYYKVSDLRFDLTYLYKIMTLSALSLIAVSVYNYMDKSYGLPMILVNFIPLLVVSLFFFFILLKGNFRALIKKDLSILKKAI